MTRLAHPTPFSTADLNAQSAMAAGLAPETDKHARPLAGMLLAAVMAALLVAADQVIDSWADGHLLAAWVALWTVTFAALALLATPLRQVANSGARWLAGRSKARAERRAEEEMWELARHDSRVMMEIRLASLRQNRGH